MPIELKFFPERFHPVTKYYLKTLIIVNMTLINKHLFEPIALEYPKEHILCQYFKTVRYTENVLLHFRKVKPKIINKIPEEPDHTQNIIGLLKHFLISILLLQFQSSFSLSICKLQMQFSKFYLTAQYALLSKSY
ncbi:hypothetical protein SK128_003098 [Halocaridina rubra]|uniref:Uncharacterized protein n=1 Tax=Halocaridina rubra TaxID=373956 RepID=A0AAN9ABR1_HALRR